MTLHKHGFDGASVTARAQLPIPNAPGKIHRCIVVSMDREPAHLAVERPLIRSVCAVGKMARCYVDTCNLVAHLFVLKAGKCAS